MNNEKDQKMYCKDCQLRYTMVILSFTSCFVCHICIYGVIVHNISLNLYNALVHIKISNKCTSRPTLYNCEICGHCNAAKL